MSIYFRRLPLAPKHSVINGQDVESVSSYKYLGTLIDDKLKFDLNTTSVCKRGQQRLSALRKLAKFQVDKTLMTLFYRAFIESILSFSIVCWYGNITIREEECTHRNCEYGQ